MKIKAIFNEQDNRQFEYINFLKKFFPEIISEQDPDIYYVIGGDGAMLHAHKNNNLSIPFFGKGLGTLNFVMNNFENDFEIINGLLNNTIFPNIIKTSKISVMVKKNNIVQDCGSAINDVVIGGNIMDWNYFEISSEKGSFDDFKFQGAGLSVSTPLGSTAFNLNNGGAMLPVDSDIWSITSVVSNKKINELLQPQKVSVKILSKRNSTSVFIDGNTTEVLLNTNDEVILERSSESFFIAFLNAHDFFNKRSMLISERR